MSYYINVLLDQWHDSFICVTWLIHRYGMIDAGLYIDGDGDVETSIGWWRRQEPNGLSRCLLDQCHDSFICVTWLIHVCDLINTGLDIDGVGDVETTMGARQIVVPLSKQISNTSDVLYDAHLRLEREIRSSSGRCVAVYCGVLQCCVLWCSVV